MIFYLTGQKTRHKNVLPRHETGSRSLTKKDKAVSSLENDPEKLSSSLSRQSSETKPRTKLALRCSIAVYQNILIGCYF